MSVLSTTQARIAATLAQIQTNEKALADHPDKRESLLASLNSLYKIRAQLHAQFIAAANAVGSNVCSYRITADVHSPGLKAVTESLGAFQRVISTIYDSLVAGPSWTGRVGPESEAATTLVPAFGMPGSFEMVLTIPNDRFALFPELVTTLDESIEVIMKLASTRDNSEITEAVRRLGYPPVRAIRHWAQAHASSGTGLVCKWWRFRGKAPLEMRRQNAEWCELLRRIDETSVETEFPPIQVSGELLGVDIAARTFHLKTSHPDVGEIRGKFWDAVGHDHVVQIPSPAYLATVVKTSRLHFATDQEKVEWFLLSLVDEGNGAARQTTHS